MKWNTGEPTKTDIEYLVTIKDMDTKETFIARDIWKKSGKIGKWENTYLMPWCKVIAWQEIPEPYEATE